MMNTIRNHYKKVCEERRDAIMQMWENPYQHESWEEFAERVYMEK